MTDPTSPVLDPVEDRLRRTFAAHAEDMAPGDADDSPPDQLSLDRPRGLRLSQWSRRPLQAAAVVVLVALAAAGAVLVARGGGDGENGRLATVGEQPNRSSVGAVTAPRGLVVALQDERNLDTSRLIGIEDAIELPMTDTAHARSATDAAVAAFEAFVAASPDGDAYRPGLVALDGLDQLRNDIDADASPRSLENIAASQEVFDRYAAIIDGLLNGQMAVANRVEDPVARAGAMAYAQGLRLDEQTARLARSGLLAGVTPGTAVVSELSRIHSDVQWGLDRLLTETTGTPYEAAAAAVVSEIDGSGLLASAGAAMEGTSDIPAILSAAEIAGQSWSAFLDGVEGILGSEH